MKPNENGKSGARSSAGLFLQLMAAIMKAYGIVFCYYSGFFNAKNLIQVHGSDRDKGGTGVSRRTGEILVVLGNESLPKVMVRLVHCMDFCNPEFIDQSTLYGTV